MAADMPQQGDGVPRPQDHLERPRARRRAEPHRRPHASWSAAPITLETAQEVLHDLLRANERRVTIDEIQKRVAEHFNIRLAEMTSARRARAVARPRQVAMYLAKQLTSRSLPEIGRKFGGRDHTTVMHAVRKIEELTLERPRPRRGCRAAAPDAAKLSRGRRDGPSGGSTGPPFGRLEQTARRACPRSSDGLPRQGLVVYSTARVKPCGGPAVDRCIPRSRTRNTAIAQNA